MSANPDGQRMPREERHAQVVAMKRTMTFRQIADELGLAMSTVTDAYYDPTGESARTRKRKVSGTCKDCGAEVFNSGSQPGERCQACAHAREKTDLRYRLTRPTGVGRAWSDDDILNAIRAVARPDGRATATDYRDAYALAPASMPSLTIIYRRFDSWAAAVCAAGLVSQIKGPYRNRVTVETCLRAVDACANEYGRVPTYNEYVEWALAAEDRPCGSTVRNRFGSWRAVMRAVLAREAVAA